MFERNRWGLLGGAVLIALGLVFLIGEFLSFNVWGYIWPFFILGVGAAFFLGMVAGGRSLGALAVPGSVITTIGLILLVQNLLGIWATWAYAWTLIIAAAGAGLIIFGGWSAIPDLVRAGRVVVTVGMMMFLVFGLFFELGASLLGMRSLGGVIWPVLLILAGLYVLFGRQLLNRYIGPVGRSVVDFGPRTSVVDGQVIEGSSTPLNTDAAPLNAETVPVGATRKVHFAAVGDLVIVQGEQDRLEIEASQAARERIHTEMQGDTLIIRNDVDWWSWLDPRAWDLGHIRFTLTLRDLQSLHSSGVGRTSIPALSTQNFTLHQSGAGNVSIRRLTTGDLTVQHTGVGSIEIEGQAQRQVVNLTGAGSYGARNLESRSARVDLRGVGSATVYATEELNVLLSGAGSLDYVGNPRLSQQVTGVGSVRKVG